MWWREHLVNWRRSVRLVVVLAAAGLTAGCFEPLYKSHPSVGGEGVQDKFAAVEIPPIKAPKGTPTERIAVAMYNALSYDLHNGGNGAPPIYRLNVDVSSSQFVAVINPTSGRPDASIEVVTATFELTEIATGKTVVNRQHHHARRLRYSRLATTVRLAARTPRCRGPRGHRRRRGYQEQAGFILRRRDLELLRCSRKSGNPHWLFSVLSSHRAFAAKHE